MNRWAGSLLHSSVTALCIIRRDLSTYTRDGLNNALRRVLVDAGLEQNFPRVSYQFHRYVRAYRVPVNEAKFGLLEYNALMDCIIKHKAGWVLDVLADMLVKDVKPDRKTMQMYLTAVAVTADTSTVETIKSQMTARGLSPCLKDYVYFIEHFFNRNLIRCGMSLFLHFKDTGLVGSDRMYRSMFVPLGQKKWVSDLWMVYEHAILQKANLDAETFYVVVKAFAKGSYFDEALKAFRDFQSVYIRSEARFLEILIFCALRMDKLEDARLLVDESRHIVVLDQSALKRFHVLAIEKKDQTLVETVESILKTHS